LNALGEVATGVENNANGSETYVVDAGFEVHKPRTNHTGELPPPADIVGKSNGLTGQAVLRFHYPKALRQQIENFAVEWSPDGESNWQNGTYRNGTNILVTDLPSRSDVHLRVRAIGTRSRKSIWLMEPVKVYVL
jgi:hypothetical protein